MFLRYSTYQIPVPPPPLVPNALKVTFGWTDGEGMFGQSFHWSYTPPAGGPAIADMLALATAHYDSFVTRFLPFFNTPYNLLSCIATPLDSPSYPIGEYVHTTVPSSAAVSPGSGVTVDLNLQVALRYRGGHFRSTFPPFAQSQMANQREWASSICTNFNTAAAEFFVDLSNKTYGGTQVELPACISYVSGGHPRGFGEVLEVTGASTRVRLGSMRRRTRLAG